MVLVPADERPHVPGGEPAWTEAWVFDFATPDASLGGRVQLTVRSTAPSCEYVAYVVGRGRVPVVVVDDAVPLPRNGGLELRTEGLWADHVVEQAFDHVSVGCEAFGLEVDETEVVTMDVRGDRVAFGLDLGWETAGPMREMPTASGYDLACEVVGQVLVGAEVIELDGIGWRRHRWGPADAASPASWLWGRTDDGRWLLGGVELEVDGGRPVRLPRIALGDAPPPPDGGVLARFRHPESGAPGTGLLGPA